MSSDSIIDLQHQVRENADDLQKYLLDLDNWEKEMKMREKELRLMDISENQAVPPVRNSVARSKKKSRHKKQKDKSSSSGKESELKKIDEEKRQSSDSDDDDNEEELCKQKKKQLAILNKDKGNEFFKKGNYDSAINCYTTGIQLDPENPLLPANRAMAFLKKEQYQAAENDCTMCLFIDPTYVKAYLRRGTARVNLKRYSLAREDFSRVLELEPENKQAQIELQKIAQKTDEMNVDDRTDEVEKMQTFWPQFLGNKNIEPSEDQSDVPSTSNIKCIFPDSQAINPLKKSDKKFSEDSLMELEVTEHKESEFKEQVEQYCRSDEGLSSNAEGLLSDVQDIVKRLEQTLPPVPSASYQFLTDWRIISKYPELKYKYLKQLPPERLPTIFKYSMEADIFPDILHILGTLFLEKGDDIFYYMKYLTKVGRFGTMLFFLSDKEKNDLNKLLDSIRSSDKPADEVEELLKLYKV